VRTIRSSVLRWMALGVAILVAVAIVAPKFDPTRRVPAASTRWPRRSSSQRHTRRPPRPWRTRSRRQRPGRSISEK